MRTFGGRLYFLTICCNQMKMLFGTVRDSAVLLNGYGRIARAELETIPLHHNALVDSAIVMPNHVHAIVFLDPRRFHESIAAGGPRPAPTRDRVS